LGTTTCMVRPGRMSTPPNLHVLPRTWRTNLTRSSSVRQMPRARPMPAVGVRHRRTLRDLGWRVRRQGSPASDTGKQVDVEHGTHRSRHLRRVLDAPLAWRPADLRGVRRSGTTLRASAKSV
jgi:hypothetical protein